MNATFRAATKAGFNQESFPGLKDVLFVTEAEAAAIYVVRYLKETEGQNFLKVRSLGDLLSSQLMSRRKMATLFSVTLVEAPW